MGTYNYASMVLFLEQGRASAIVGGQFGSEAKGLAAGVVNEYADYPENHKLICTTNAGAQAGHTTVLEDGRQFVCYHLPTLGVLRQGSTIYLNAGSIIDPVLLHNEIEMVSKVTGESLDSLSGRIIIHPNAAVIHQSHKEREQNETTHLGSTRKGVGAALSDKIMRHPMAVASQEEGLVEAFRMHPIDLNMDMTHKRYAVCVEIPQGTGLSLNNGEFYPNCTSRDCWVGAGLADAGIHPRFLHHTMMVQRSMPIRVGHIHDDQGRMIGHSGDFYPDSIELDWGKDLPHLTPEITTVTKRRRRIATFSATQYWAALSLNRPTHVLNTFCNYLDQEGLKYWKWQLEHVDLKVGIKPHHIWSFGPKASDTRFDIGG